MKGVASKEELLEIKRRTQAGKATPDDAKVLDSYARQLVDTLRELKGQADRLGVNIPDGW